MAEQAAPTAIREAIAARLREISTANGYRTDAGADVRTEPSQFAIEDGPRITVWPATRHLPDDFKSWGERSMRVVVEAQVSVERETQLAELEAVEADIEDALDEYVLPSNSLPMRFVESVTLDRPEGMPSVCAQVMFATRYRR